MTEIPSNSEKQDEIPQEELDKLDWDAIGAGVAEFIVDARKTIKPSMMILSKDTLAAHFSTHREMLLKRFLAPVQSFLLKSGVTKLMLDHPKSMKPPK